MNETLTPCQVEELAESRLRRTGLQFSQQVSCEYDEGTLLLRGRVRSYYLKQVAQTVIADLPGVEHVDNGIQVLAGSRQ